MVTTIRLQCILLLMILYVIGCVHFPKNKTKNELEANAVQTLFNYEVEDFDQWSKNIDVVFIGYGWDGWDGNISPMPHHFAPAPKEWVKGLSIPNVEIKNVTESIGLDNGFLVADKATGKRGCVFQVEKITWISSNEMHMDIWWYSGFMHATIQRWILVLQNGKWQAHPNFDRWSIQ